MKKVLILSVIILSVITACKKTEFLDMRVFPLIKDVPVARGGESLLVLQVEIPEQSHIYGNPKGPGTGKPTEVFIQNSPGLIFQSARYLPGEKFYFFGERDYTWGYRHETRIYIPFSAGEDTRVGTRQVTIIFDSLLCTDSAGVSGPSSCTPRIFTFTCPIRIMPKGAAGAVYDEKIISEYGSSLAPVKTGSTIEKNKAAVMSGGVSAIPGGLKFEPRYIEPGVSGIFQAILFGVIAGFLLNFMPCVLPVVSLKVMSFVQHAEKSRKELLVLGLIFSLGILASFAILASLAAFFGYRWGGLFQHRLFLVIMTGIVFALALSLFGVYSINVPSFMGRVVKKTDNHYADAFIKGLLATLLATPCSGPFLGGTLAWTLSQPPLVIFTIFMSIGLGMSLPYLILTINPAFLKYIPKPGEWLKTFEQVMAFLLVFTVIYLIGIFEITLIKTLILFLGFIAVGLWQFGRFGAIYQSGLKRVLSFLALIIIVGVGYFISFEHIYRETGKEKLRSSDFTIQRMMDNGTAGRISVIEFTAAWCPNCVLVEKVSLRTERVSAALNSPDVDFMVADITGSNPTAEKLMQLFRSQSIPLLAIVPPGDFFNRPIILRDIYSPADVEKALEIARKSEKKKELFKYQLDIQGNK